MYSIVTRGFFVLAVFMGFSTTVHAEILIRDDFEGEKAGLFPTINYWSDVGRVGRSKNVAPDPSVTVIDTSDPFGNRTKAVQISAAIADSQGIYLKDKVIATSRFIGISVDVRVDRYAAKSRLDIQDWAWDIALAKTGLGDFSLAPSFGAFVASNERKAKTFAQGHSGGTDTRLLSTKTLRPGVWYNVNLGLNRSNGTIRVILTEIATKNRIFDRTNKIASWRGFNREPQFDAVAFFDGELSAPRVANVTLFDNILIADTAIPVVLLSHPMKRKR